MNTRTSIKEQLRRNLVALISLAIAVTSLGYNTWRNEASEDNRNQRLVSIQVLLMLGELQRLTMDRHYGENIDERAVSRAAWAKVLTIRDLAQVVDGSVPDSAIKLHEVWNRRNGELGRKEKAVKKAAANEEIKAIDEIIAALELVRSKTHEVLRSLD